MNIARIIIALVFPFICAGQNVPDHTNKLLNGKIKTVSYSSATSANAMELVTKTVDKNNYSMDSFDNNGQKLRSYIIARGIEIALFDYKIDNNGHITEEVEHDKIARANILTTFSYNKQGKIIVEKKYDHLGVLSRQINYSYAFGKIKIVEDSIEGCSNKTIYNYNNKEKLIEAVTFHCSGDTAKYRYDDEGNKISATYGSVNMIWKYDQYNNLILEERYRADGTLVERLTTEYIYDNHNNWTRRIRDIRHALGDIEILKELTVRSIDYYK